MSCRNLTEAFIIMRNNALQTKHIYAEQVSQLKINCSIHNNNFKLPQIMPLRFSRLKHYCQLINFLTEFIRSSSSCGSRN